MFIYHEYPVTIIFITPALPCGEVGRASGRVGPSSLPMRNRYSTARMTTYRRGMLSPPWNAPKLTFTVPLTGAPTSRLAWSNVTVPSTKMRLLSLFRLSINLAKNHKGFPSMTIPFTGAGSDDAWNAAELVTSVSIHCWLFDFRRP